MSELERFMNTFKAEDLRLGEIDSVLKNQEQNEKQTNNRGDNKSGKERKRMYRGTIRVEGGDECGRNIF